MVRALIQRAAICILLVLPWISPLASGPSPSVDSFLISWSCAIGVAAILYRPSVGWITSLWILATILASLATLSRAPTLWVIALVAFLVAGTSSVAKTQLGKPALADSQPVASLAPLVVAAVATAATINSLFALLQQFGQAHWFYPLINTAQAGDVYGNLRQRNQMATLTALGMVSIIWLRGVGARNWLVLPVLMLLAAANAATVSRTGAVLLVLVGIALWIRRRNLTTLVETSAMACGYALMIWTMQGGETAITRAAEVQIQCGSRLILWSNVMELVQQRPLTGWGWGHLDEAHFLRLYAGRRFCEIPDNAHNLPLHLAVELGVPMAAGLLALCLWGVWKARPWAEQDRNKLWAWVVLSMIGVHSLLEYPLWYGPFQVLALIAVILLAGRPLHALRHSWLCASSLVGPALAVCAALLMSAAWEYHRVSQLYLHSERRSPLYSDNTFQKVSWSVFFSDQLDFAILTTRRITRDNAASTAEMAKSLLAYSPEPRVVELLVQSLSLLGRDAEARFYAERFQAAYPEEYSRWLARSQPAE